jgi:hypothetical protein
MSERWVVNSSPLIFLCRLRCEEWLLALADEVIVPARRLGDRRRDDPK